MMADEEFQYLRRRSNGEEAYNPYDVKVVSYSEADHSDLYTISKRGIMRHRKGKEGEFWTYEQWEKEHSYFEQIKKLKLFSMHKKWKSFK